MKGRIYRIATACVIVLAVAACNQPVAPVQTLEERVTARWQHMIDRDFGAAWEYYSPGFRETTPREVFVADAGLRPIQWHAAEMISKDCQEDACKVNVGVIYQAVGAPSALRDIQVNRQVEESWVRLGGVWWYLPPR